MSGQISKVKRQLRSVISTKKLTNAMSLVATAKLQKQKGIMASNNQYANTYYRFLIAALSAPRETQEETNGYLTLSDVGNPLHIVITSNSGLCGSYNMELLKYVEKTIPKDEAIFAVGSYGIKWLMERDYLVIKKIDDLDDVKPSRINQVIANALQLYADNEISSIDIIYTRYVNTLTFVPDTYKLLPIEITEEIKPSDILLEPSRDAVLNQLIPQYVSSKIYSIFLQSKTSESAARRSAMDGANQNADKLIAELKLKYNRERQTAITQEMNEITAGSAK